jgi:hypothetical protein
MTQAAIVIALAVGLIALVRWRLLQIDFSFPWLLLIVGLGFASLNDRFVDWIAAQLGIVYQPIAILLLVIFAVLGITTFHAILLSRLRERHISVVRRLAALELSVQDGSRAESEGALHEITPRGRDGE